MKYDRVSFTWVSDEEYARRVADREERIFQKRANQGELCCPMIISDSLGFRGLRSQVDGRMYDSKSNLRKHYRHSGVVEVGNEVKPDQGRFWDGKPPADPHKDRKQMDAIGKAFNRVGLPTC